MKRTPGKPRLTPRERSLLIDRREMHLAVLQIADELEYAPSLAVGVDHALFWLHALKVFAENAASHPREHAARLTTLHFGRVFGERTLRRKVKDFNEGGAPALIPTQALFGGRPPKGGRKQRPEGKVRKNPYSAKLAAELDKSRDHTFSN